MRVKRIDLILWSSFSFEHDVALHGGWVGVHSFVLAKHLWKEEVESVVDVWLVDERSIVELPRFAEGSGTNNARCCRIDRLDCCAPVGHETSNSRIIDIFDAVLNYDFVGPVSSKSLEVVRDTLPHCKELFAQGRILEHIGV